MGATKRKASSPAAKPDPAAQDGGGGGDAAAPTRHRVESTVNERRIRPLNSASPPPPNTAAPVLYWMSRDQRLADNWALLAAAQAAAASGAPLGVAFNLVPAFLGAGARQFGFMLRGLAELHAALDGTGIAFFLVRGDPGDTIPALAQRVGAGRVFTDYSPLRLSRAWKAAVAAKLNVPFYEVDAHNVVPVWAASDKKEVGARTLRPKIHRALPEFLTEFPALPTLIPWGKGKGGEPAPDPIDWPAVIDEATAAGAAVPEVTWLPPGEAAGRARMDAFLGGPALARYDAQRNDPGAGALSNLSPYLHFGQLGGQRLALATLAAKPRARAAADALFEESVVRRELSDNYCHYEPNYDSLDGAAGWARETLEVHAADAREFTYTRAQFEAASTHDDLWNAAQRELTVLGKMHGFMRMYWAKKILEWSPTPAEALATAIHLNDTYELDGRDPSGYVGCMWSICGVHDMGWTERRVFGKIRFMNYAGCKRKFNIQRYIDAVDAACAREEAARQRAGG